MSSTDSKGTDPVDAPFQSLSKDSQGPWLIVCAYVCILLTVMTIFIKLFTRFKATNRLTANDCFILTAGVSSRVHNRVLFGAPADLLNTVPRHRTNHHHYSCRPLWPWSAPEESLTVQIRDIREGWSLDGRLVLLLNLR